MRSFFSFLLLSAVSAACAASTGCAVTADRGDPAGVESDTDQDEAAASTTVFYAVRQDFRKCMSPMCGGYFYKKLNKATTTCVGGGSQEWCYAWSADFSAVDAASGGEQVIFTGTVKTETVNGGTWGKFVAATAWKSLTTTAPTEVYGADPRFYLVKDNGVRCITTPCYSIDANRINLSYKTTLSGVDLGGVIGSTSEQRDAAMATLSNGLVVFGVIKTGKGRDLAGHQAYVQVKRAPNYCASDSDCTSSSYTRPVTKKSECYCPMCPTPFSSATATANKAGFDKYCSTTGCPIPPCAPPPGAVACIENACRYSFDPVP